MTKDERRCRYALGRDIVCVPHSGTWTVAVVVGYDQESDYYTYLPLLYDGTRLSRIDMPTFQSVGNGLQAGRLSIPQGRKIERGQTTTVGRLTVSMPLGQFIMATKKARLAMV